MDRAYSILILPHQGTQMRRILLPSRSIRSLLWGLVVLMGAGAWFLGDYIWLNLQRKASEQVIVEAKAQQERLAALHQQTMHIQQLVTNLNGLKAKIQGSLPAKRSWSANGHHSVEELEKSLISLQSELEGLIASVPTSWPTNGGLQVSSGVGMRFSPWTGEREFHSGLDIPRPMGTPVYAPGDGAVKLVGRSNGSGLAVILNHGQGITSSYAHLSRAFVKRGDWVLKGQQIAAVGNTGRSTSPHLHYEVRVDGVPIDPRRKLLAMGSNEANGDTSP